MSAHSLTWQQRLGLYARLVRLDKPIGILLLLWPTWWGLWSASNGVPDWRYWLIFSLGTVLMRSAGCAFNDYFDRDFDLHVERTKERVLTSGKIHPKEALMVGVVLSLLALLLILPLNGLTWLLAVVAAVLAVTYPLFKRFFAIPQAYLGIAFGFGIPMAFAAIQNQVPLVAWLMLAANVAWAIAYDTEYAMVDKEDDLKLGLKTSAITFGRWDVTMVALCYALTLALLFVVAYLLGYNPWFYMSLIAALMVALRHIYWIRTRDREQCFRAFLHNTWFGFIVWVGFVLTTIFPTRGVL